MWGRYNWENIKSMTFFNDDFRSMLPKTDLCSYIRSMLGQCAHTNFFVKTRKLQKYDIDIKSMLVFNDDFRSMLQCAHTNFFGTFF